MTYTIHADTPEEARTEIVRWLNMCASTHRIAANKATLITSKRMSIASAITYQTAADFVEKMKIEGKE